MTVSSGQGSEVCGGVARYTDNQHWAVEGGVGDTR